MSNSNVEIETLQSLTDGISAIATTSGNPNGTLTFYAARVPDVTKSVLITSSGTNPYTLTLPHAGIWYVWAHDTDGYSVDFEAELVESAPHTDLDAVGQRVRDILVDNKVGLEACLRKIYAKATIKQIVYGSEAEVTEYPAIVVNRPTFDTKWAFMPFGKEYDYNLSISCKTVHYDEGSEIGLCDALVGAVERVLNNPNYTELTLDMGINLYSCLATQGSVSEQDLGNYFYSEGSVAWTGNALVQDGGN